MKTEQNILLAFILNLLFAVFECIGGTVIGSVAIVSDAVHDAGDAISIGVSYVLERKSKRPPDETYTYGYGRYAVIGGCITTSVLIIGAAVMIGNAVRRIIHPVAINYNSMILFAIVGVCVNFCAAFFTHKGHSVNQKAVNLHMLEDVLGWMVVLIGAVVMRFTDMALLDPILSIGVSLFILVNAFKNLKEIADLLLEKAPRHMDTVKIKRNLEEIDGVLEVHHIHLWTPDGQNALATMHVVADQEPRQIKENIRRELHKHGINHVTIETETTAEDCGDKHCHIAYCTDFGHHHHHDAV